jgi:hypothetical protein
LGTGASPLSRGSRVSRAVHTLCGPDGQLTLEGVEVAAWQAVEVPRIFDDPDQEPDAGPHEELSAMFRRARRPHGVDADPRPPPTLGRAKR